MSKPAFPATLVREVRARFAASPSTVSVCFESDHPAMCVADHLCALYNRRAREKSAARAFEGLRGHFGEVVETDYGTVPGRGPLPTDTGPG